MKFVLFCAAGALVSATATPPTGLQLFRKAGHDGLSCSRCHSPDGIEIGAFGFSHADIVRRASAHLSKSDAVLLANYLSSPDNGQPALKPDSDRPLQPGQRLLPGSTASARDEAFGKEISKFVPELTGPPIRTQASALAARDRLFALDPRTVPIGIPFNRLSEDGFHGKEHASVADWIPDVGLDLTPKFTALEDAYLADPSSSRLEALEKEAGAMVPMSLLQQLAIGKFRALLLLQHAIRVGGPEAARLDKIELVGPGNPFWEVADVAHHNSEGDMGMFDSSDALKQKKKGVPFAQQMHELRLPWFWIGWTLDPSLRHLGRGPAGTTVRADYFTKFLWEDGPYPNHMAFMLSKKLVEAGFSKNLPPTRIPQHYEIQFSNFLLGNRLLDERPAWESYRPLVDRISGNAFRIALLLLEEDIDRTHACVRPLSQSGQIECMRKFFRIAGERDDMELCDRVDTKLKATHSDDND